MAKIKQFFRLLFIHGKIDMMWFLRDTKYALIAIFADVLAHLSSLSAVYFIAVRFEGIGAMTKEEVLFMLAFSTLTSGLFELFGSNNNIYISRIIGRGQLEHCFIQPIGLPMQLLTGGFCPFTGSMNFIIGIFLTVHAVKSLQLTVTPLWLLALLAYVFLSLATITARSYLFSSITFYAPVAAEEISSTVLDGSWQLSTYPLSGMPKWLQFSLVSLVPEGLVAWFPALSLLGKPPLALGKFYPLFFALFLGFLAKHFFQKGLNYYVKTGANRYLPYGFRR